MKMKSCKTKGKYKKLPPKKNKEKLEDSVNIRSLLSKFVTNIFEKNYSNANSILETVITEKLKKKIKTSAKKKKCSCGCDECEEK